MSLPFSKVPASVTLKPVPFQVKIDDSAIEELNLLLKNAKFPKDTYENQTEDGSFGVSKGWVEDTVDYWANQFDWRKREEKINSYPHFKVPVKDDLDGTVYDIHFVALFSEKPDAVPIIFIHGWPGSFLEFQGILDLLRQKYTPQTLPYHVIVPSLPGFTLSALPLLERDFTRKDTARIFDLLAIGLGFDRYIAQGGDIGSFVSTTLGTTYPACKAVHLNASFMSPPENYDMDKLTEQEKAGIARGEEFFATGIAYAQTHNTRPSTIGIALSSSPVALLAWIGEKFVSWSDETPSLDAILESISLYWFTDTIPSALWFYREYFAEQAKQADTSLSNRSKPYISTFLGFSNFHQELAPKPKDWVAMLGNLVAFKDHPKGGHFAALEEPEQLLDDVEEFVSIIRDKI